MASVPEQFVNTVVFLCIDEPDDSGIPQRVPKATGFFVRVPLAVRPGESVDYLVTARHCVEEAMTSEYLWIRWNLKAGGVVEVCTKSTDWIMSETSDVAAILMLRSVLPEGQSVTDYDSGSLVIADFVGPEPAYEYVGESALGHIEFQPNVGHEVFFLGLFTQQYENEHNLPIARFGHISRMPSYVAMKGPGGTRFNSIVYLMEFQSWGGNSGSPVFFLQETITEDHEIVNGTAVTTRVNEVNISGFMGLVNGHYEIPTKADAESRTLGEIETRLNSGIAMVTPADSVRQLLMREDVVEYREEQTLKYLDAEGDT